MNLLTNRTRLLSGAALGLGLTMVGAQPAAASCVITAATATTPRTVVCGTTTTTDTTNAGTTPASDRHYPADTSAAGFTLTVSSGAVVDGYGLAVTNTVGGANTLAVVNNGSVTASAVATQGNDGALRVNAIGATNVTYSGTGSITNTAAGALSDGLSIHHSGTGNITATVGGNVSVQAPLGYAIWAEQNGTAGNVSVTTATGTTVRSAQRGISANVNNAASAGTVTVTNNATIAGPVAAPNSLDYGIFASSAGTGAVSVTNTGAIGAAADRATVAGINAVISNVASAAPLSVSGSGAIFSSGTGISAINRGTGTTTVNYTGAINSTGQYGLVVDGGTGLTTVTAGAVTGATDGVIVSSLGAQAITLNGVTTGTGGYGLLSGTSSTSTTPAARTITVGAGGNVTGGLAAIGLTGTAATTLTNNGIIGTTPTGVAIIDLGGGDSTITNAATGTLNGVVTLDGGNDVLINAGLWNVAGAVDFGAGTDRLQNTGRITLAGNTQLVGLESIGSATTAGNAGRIDLGTFTLTGPAIVFTNNATGNVTTGGNAALAGFTSVANAGTFTLGNGTLTVPAGAFTNTGSVIARSGPLGAISGQTVFTNTGGQLLLNDGVTDDVLTINSNFNASGNSRLQIDASATTADRLVVNGNINAAAGTGPTTVFVNTVPGTVGFSTAGILIVDATGTTAANSFTTTAVANSLISYGLEQRGNDVFLVTLPSTGAFAPVLLGGLVQDSWYTGAEAFNAMAAARGGKSTGGISIWAQPLYAREHYGKESHTFNALNRTFTIPTRTRITRQGIQGGIDFDSSFGAVGITGGYQQAELDGGDPTQPIAGVTPFLVNSSQADGWNIGAYAMMGGPVGLYGNALIKYDSNKVDVEGGAFDQLGVNFDSNSYGIDGEVGYRSAAEGTSFEGLAGLSYVNADLDGFDILGINYRYDDVTSLRARLGGRVVFNQFERLFVGGKILHEFSGDTDLVLDSTSDVAVRNKGRGTWGRVEVGIGGSPEMPFNIMAWQNVGDLKGFGVTGGLRLTFGGGSRPVEMAPPPPPPPPPPPAYVPPAEQPAPPPPPPPPPAPGERG